MNFKFSFLVAALCGSVWASAASMDKKRPNVVFIMCDDLNDYISGMKGHDQSQTPALARFAESAVMFKRAYSNNPVCAPSRASVFTGIYPHTSKNLFWGKWFQNAILKNSKTMMEHFADNGYYVTGSGKLLHHFTKNVWPHYNKQADYGPFYSLNGKASVAHPGVPAPFNSIGAIDGSFGALEAIPKNRAQGEGWLRGSWKVKDRSLNFDDSARRDMTPDEENAAWAAAQIKSFEKNGQDQPFFLGVGFVRPHTPLHVPQKYFDMFPLDKIQLPTIKKNDASDTFYTEVFDGDKKGLKYFELLKQSYPNQEAGIRAFTQAYLASIAAVDDCIGQVIDAVNSSPLKDNTIIVFTSDHGWNMGEKDYLFKNSLWEESGRVPMIIRAPGIGKVGHLAEHPVALIDLYPTLVDLCNLKGDTRKNEQGAKLDGFSMKPLLINPKASDWQGPKTALTMVYAGPHTKMDPDLQHWTTRSKNWRYIRYNNGKEELYNHLEDPNEWTNLASNPEYKSTLDKMRSELIEQANLDFSKAIPPLRKKWAPITQ